MAASESKQDLLEVILDSWDRNNAILVNLLRILPPEGLAARVSADSHTVAQLFMHMHAVRLVFLEEDAPSYALPLPTEEWQDERSSERIAELLTESAIAVRNAVERLTNQGIATELHYDHPLLLLQHMIWHEGYHQGQIKLILKLVGNPIPDEQAGPATWQVWMKKRGGATSSSS